MWTENLIIYIVFTLFLISEAEVYRISLVNKWTMFTNFEKFTRELFVSMEIDSSTNWIRELSCLTRVDILYIFCSWILKSRRWANLIFDVDVTFNKRFKVIQISCKYEMLKDNPSLIVKLKRFSEFSEFFRIL